MKKKTVVTLLIIFSVLASVAIFYGTNLLYSDLSNMFYGVHDYYIISSIPFFMISLDLTLLPILLVRLYRRQDCKKALLHLYTIYMAVNGFVGAVFSVLSGTIVYHSMLAPYPFFAYPLIMLIVNLVLMVEGIILCVIAHKTLPKDEGKIKINFAYVVYNALLGLLVYYGFFRTGSFLWAPFYVYLRNLEYTCFFYASLLIPMALMVYLACHFMGFFKKGKYFGKSLFLWIIFVANTVFGGLTILYGIRDTGFISSISPALPLERLATKPITTLAYIGVIYLLTIGLLITNGVHKRRERIEREKALEKARKEKAALKKAEEAAKNAKKASKSAKKEVKTAKKAAKSAKKAAKTTKTKKSK